MKDIDYSIDQYRAGEKGIIVYLESNTDKHIFEKWFGDFFGEIEFASISNRKSDGGCTRVINYIENYDQNTTNVKAYGIVDRDALLGQINNNSPHKTAYEQAWWEIDDTTFIAAQPFGNKIFVLTRWELENYLLHPEVLRKLIQDKTMGAISFPNDQAIAQCIIDSELELIAVTVFSTLAGRGGAGRFEQDSGRKLWKEIRKALPATVEKRDIKKHLNSIYAFSENIQNPVDRWERLSRMLDGKRVMKRLDELLTSRGIIFDKECGVLAEYVANSKSNLIDPHLTAWLQSIST